MRSIVVTLACLSMLAACGGAPAASGPQGTPNNQPTGGQPTAGQPSASAQPTAAGTPVAQPGGGNVAVVLTGGEHAGTYSGSGETNCSSGFVGEGVWGVQYSITEAAPDQFSAVQMVWREGEEGQGEMFSGVKMLLTIGFGDLLGDYTPYEIEVRTDNEDSKGDGTVEISDSGSTAVIHATGTTADGVVIDATINCPTVTRG